VKVETHEPAYSTDCPHCGKAIRFYRFSGMGELAPHFYCNRCSNVFFRESDRTCAWGKAATPELLQAIAATLPACACGGHFQPGQNPKCPHCKQPLPHQANPVDRLFDPYAVLVEGAVLVRE